jgi:ABC-type multidrug transport system permease subunit
LLKKDLALFLANRFYLLMTVVGLVFYVAAYFVLPRTVNESLSLAMYAPTIPPSFQQLTQQPGTSIKLFDTEDDMLQAILKGNYQAGIALPPDILTVWANGGRPKITVFYQAGSPPEVADAITALVKELSYAQTGQALTAEVTEQTLGPDRLGTQVALRDRMRPLLAVFILLLEIMSLASLITVEIEQGTARALLVTPMRTAELYAAKAILGVGLALVQALVFMGMVGGFNHQPLIILLTFLIGSVLVVGTGFLMAALAKDVTAVTGWGVLVFVILTIPGLGSLIPGLLSGWAKVIPSFFLTDTVMRVTNYGAGWGEVAGNLAILAAISAALVALGLVTLKRRYL